MEISFVNLSVHPIVSQEIFWKPDQNKIEMMV